MQICLFLVIHAIDFSIPKSKDLVCLWGSKLAIHKIEEMIKDRMSSSKRNSRITDYGQSMKRERERERERERMVQKVSLMK